MVVPSNPRREQVLKLIDEKDKIEKKISDLGVVLQQVTNEAYLLVCFDFNLCLFLKNLSESCCYK